MQRDYKSKNATPSESLHMPSPRIAARALILRDDKLLLVNAYPAGQSDLWCAPGGGVEKHTSLPDNLIREVREETGLTILVGAPALINEFHDPDLNFHQIDIYFRCDITSGELSSDWCDPEGIVSERCFFSRTEMAHIAFKPDSLPDAAWGDTLLYDPLERLIKPTGA
ncbi:ADP-ribose pyrophosphatase YjhB, NUDIX family [Shimia haliotis]|uniref:ADP-ribose pyrophosphatase YjhB, NUDIX family n=2 Tax=Shimia haliotis TaxID=1280847 RepID=A0A1I4DUU1_9RHOB|nr:ADP-ribose pyrophosphatase YjhB, NUDIX family [Shimia haliotis]